MKKLLERLRKQRRDAFRRWEAKQPPLDIGKLIEEGYELDKLLEDAESGTEWDKRNQDEDLDDEEMNVIRETKLKDWK